MHNALVGFGLRDRIKIIASGRITTGFQIIQRVAVGADLCASARGFMFALGCIQALRCNSNQCPVGVATQDPGRVKGLVVSDKGQRVANYHEGTVKAFLEALGAAGMTDPRELRPWHIQRRVAHPQVRNYSEIHSYLEFGALLDEPYPPGWEGSMRIASPDRFRPSLREVQEVDRKRGLAGPATTL